MALVTSLFHDAGYIREFGDRQHRNGAEFTLYHVTRSARFLARFLPSIGMENWVPVSTRIVHFTGYEIKLDMIQLADPRGPQARAPAGHRGFDRANGGSLLSREVPRPAVSGIRAGRNRRRDRQPTAPCRSATARVWIYCGRLRNSCAKHACSGSRANSNMPTAMSKLCSTARIPTSRPSTAIWVILHRVLRTERWPMLRRNPPLFTSGDNQSGQVRGLMLTHLKALWA